VIAGCDRHLKLRHRETHNELPGYVGLVYDVIPAGRG